ncbi:Kri1 protein [Candida orthopsilosis Co 90-125]|uniref:Kri1 protein n=1 Tax=Candida orthopsilosis (strain 90-125) TaxID=1136231 RepID=H8X195_CANO9|nr:Kri1 protein [Candida orthopsilosis Co 90-125]CCG22135.1 Kri1 protein [Candida orthopsilosis Co 90-125]
MIISSVQTLVGSTMPRKKSATKKAKEQALKQSNTETGSSLVDTKVVAPTAPNDQTPESHSESTTSDEEEEDEFGDLITDEVERGINKVLEKIKSDPKSLLDPNLKFFKDPESDDILVKKQGEKPMFLKDYHRQNLIDGAYKEFDENETVDGVKSFATEQKEERDKLLNYINNAFDEEDDGDDREDGFLKKKEKGEEVEENTQNLPDPEKDQNAFLSAFLDQKAWIPKQGDKMIDLDQIDRNDEEDFDNAVEDFEKAYNFRYEDANSTEIISYARNQATLRRGKTNSRKRAREKAHEEKKKVEEHKAELLRKKKTAKLNKVVDRLAKIKEAVGNEVSDEVIQKVFGDSLLNEDFDDADWDNRMAEIFNEQYYGAEIEKPTWDDDLMEGMDDESDDDEDADNMDVEEEPQKKKAKKEKLKEKSSLKKEKEALRTRALEIVDANTLKIQEEVEEEEERGRKKDAGEIKFKYREVSPESFGLSTREILLADDKQLNSFIGIKKFAPYRPKELRLKDKRKYTKKKHLQEWRKETFKNLNIPEDAKDGEIWIPADDAAKQKGTKRSHKSK